LDNKQEIANQGRKK